MKEEKPNLIEPIEYGKWRWGTVKMGQLYRVFENQMELSEKINEIIEVLNEPRKQKKK